MAKGKPRRDGSGKGTRKNRGRSGCKVTKKTGQGRRWFVKNSKGGQNKW